MSAKFPALKYGLTLVKEHKMASLILDSRKINLKFSPAVIEPRDGKLISRTCMRDQYVQIDLCTHAVALFCMVVRIDI